MGITVFQLKRSVALIKQEKARSVAELTSLCWTAFCFDPQLCIDPIRVRYQDEWCIFCQNDFTYSALIKRNVDAVSHILFIYGKFHSFPPSWSPASKFLIPPREEFPFFSSSTLLSEAASFPLACVKLSIFFILVTARRLSGRYLFMFHWGH